MKIENQVLGDVYRTPDSVRPCILQKLFGWSRLPAHLMLHHAVYACNKRIRNGILSKENFESSAWQAIHQLETCDVRFEISGFLNLQSLTRAAVIVGNHMSLVETLTLAGGIITGTNRQCSFVVKESLLRYPLMGAVLLGIDAIGIGRENPRDDFRTVMEKGALVLGHDSNLVIFPQSTRSCVFDPSLFNSIGVKLAKSASVPVVPLALKTDVFENGSLIKDFGPVFRERTIHMSFGEPMEVRGNGRSEHRAIVEFIERNLREWGGRIAPSSRENSNETLTGA